MAFKQFCSPHVHVSSLDSASTPAAFVKRELELGSKTLTTTDHGSLVACRQVYKLAKKAGLIPVVGVEGYFQDYSCEKAQRSKYYHVTIHCPTQHCFEVVTKRISRADVERGQQAGSERKPIFTWEDLEEIAAAGATFGSGCLVGMVQRHLADSDDPEMAQKYFERLMGMAPGRFFVEVFPHRTDRNWMSGVRVVKEGGGNVDYRSKKKLRLDGGEIHVDDLPKLFSKNPQQYGKIRAVMENRKWVELAEPIVIQSASAVDDYVKNDCSPWAPDGDSQEGANRFVLEMAKRHKILVLVSDDCLAVGTVVRCLDKYRPIEDVRPGQKVLSHDGRWVEVEATRGFFTKKQCVSVHVAGFPVTMTVDHRVWVRKVPVSTWMVPMNKLHHTIPEWGDAGDLKKGDFVYIPAPPIVGGVDSRSFDMVEFVNHRWRFTTTDDRVEATNHLNGEKVWFKRHLVVDERLAWVLGFFVGDGSAHNNTSSFVCDSETYDKILRSQLIDLTAEYNFSWDEKRFKNYAVFRIVNTAFTQFLRKNFYDTSKEKRVPEWVRGMTASWQAKFLTGLMYADGSGTSSSNYSLSVTSLDVAGYARDTGLALGAYSILGSRRTTGSVRDLYTVGFSQEIGHVCDLWSPLSGPRGKARWIRDDGGFWVRITSVEPAGSDLLVYDLQVAETGSFCTSTFAVHNSHFTHPEDKVVQDVRLGAGSNGAWRMYSSYHRMSSDEAFAHFQASLGTTKKEFEGWVDNSLAWAEMFKGFSLKSQPQLPTNFYPGDPIERLFTLIAAEGRFNPDDQRQVERLTKELGILHSNGKIDLIPYFFVTQEVVKLYEAHGKLTGPGRGSAAGLLTAYLLGITHVDPIRFNLSTERFITKERILSGKMPDIDQDLPDRDLLEGVGEESGWLQQRFGRNVAQIGALTSMKLRSSIKDVCRVMFPGGVPAEVEELTSRMLKPPQGVDDAKFVFGYVDDEDVKHDGSITYDTALMEFAQKYPAPWAVAQKCLGLTRQRTRHPCGFAIAGREIDDLVPLTVVGKEKSVTTSFPADGCEDAGIIKYDFLTVNSVRDIDQCLKLIRARTPGWESLPGLRGVRAVPFRGQLYDVWDLPNDPVVLRELAAGHTETVFQLCTPSAKKWLKAFNHNKPDGTPVLGSVEAMAAFVALDRPGPLNAELMSPDGGNHNMMVEYTRRARGQQGSPDINDKFEKLFPETYSLPVYQEQIEKLTQEMAGISASEAVELRGLLAKKKKDEVEKWRPRFVQGATKVLGSEEEASKLWALVYNYAQYSFNKSVAAGTILESCNSGRKAIEHFLPGDEIRGVDSHGTVITTQVVGLHDHGELEAYEVTFDDGFVVVTSARHKFLTLLGQTPLHEIVVRGLEVLADAQKQRRLEDEVWCGRSKQSDAASTSEGVFPLSQCETSGCDIDPTVWRLFLQLGRTHEGELAELVPSNAQLSSTGDLVLRSVVRVRSVGIRRMYDLEVAHERHNFLLPNGVVTSNSHSVCYAVIAYACGWLKHHFPLEWWCSVLRNADKNEVEETFWQHCGKLVDPPHVNLSGANYEIRDGRIRAPISLINGVGERAQKQLEEGRPYTDIRDFVTKQRDWQRRNATKVSPVSPPKSRSKKTSAAEGIKLATSALHRGVVGKLISSGVMDSLFSPGMTLLDQLDSYEQILAEVTGCKREPVDPMYGKLTEIQRYQLRKSVLPAYSDCLTRMVHPPDLEAVSHLSISHTSSRSYLVDGNVERLVVPTYDEVQFMNFHEPLSTELAVGVVAYVTTARPFTWDGKVAVEYVLELDGGRFRAVWWPRKNRRPKDFGTGAVVAGRMSRSRSGSVFSIDYLVSVSPPL